LESARKVHDRKLEGYASQIAGGAFMNEKKSAEIKLNLCEPKFDSIFLSPEKNKPGGSIVSFAKIYDFRMAQAGKSKVYIWRFNLALARGECAKVSYYPGSHYQSRDSMNSVKRDRDFELLMVEADNEKADQKIRFYRRIRLLRAWWPFTIPSGSKFSRKNTEDIS
jgi:hypothetical protein